MPDLSRDIHPPADCKRTTTQFLRRLQETGEPVVLTINGTAELVVQDARSYQKLLELAQRLETLEVIREGLNGIEEGKGRPMAEAFDELERGLRVQQGV